MLTLTLFCYLTAANSQTDINSAVNPLITSGHRHLTAKWWPDKDVGNLVIFMHIPKSGGTHFHYLVGQTILKTDNVTFYPTDGNSWNTKGCTAQKEVGGSHCGNTEITQCLRSGDSKVEGVLHDPANAPFKYVTVLRKPVERAISEFFWHYPCSSICTATELCNADFLTYITSPANTLRNLQAKMLVSLPSMQDQKFRVDPEHCANSFAHVNQVAFWNDYYARKDGLEPPVPGATDAIRWHVEHKIEDRFNDDEELFENIKTNIRENFALVAVAEQLGAAEKLLRELYPSLSQREIDNLHRSQHPAHKSPISLKGKGRNFRKSDVTTEMRAEMERVNRMDMRLYQWVINTYYPPTPVSASVATAAAGRA